jgi:hypothetical protein
MKILWALYLLFAAGATALYAASEMWGWEPPSAAYERIDPSVRTPPGSNGSGSTGHSGGFWHSGSHGGK